jgi:S1-C subfamily serine protease
MSNVRRLSSAFVVALAASLAAAPAFAGDDKPAKDAKPAPAKPVVGGSMSKARELSEAVIAVADKVSPSVVQIDVTVHDDASGSGDSGPWWLKRHSDSVVHGNGSGVIISTDGYVLTNNHVVEDALTITIRTRDGKILSGKVKGRDPATDLAVVKVEASGLAAAKLGDSVLARVGEWVVAVGSPFGLSYSVTTGVISAKDRGGLGMNAVEDYIQTDASINPGNSGGPLVSLGGEVLGINTMIVGRGSGIGFAVPSNIARRVADQLIKTGKVQRAWLGVGVQDLTPDLAKAFGVAPYAGVLINEIAPTGPAAAGKIVAGDIVTKVAGKPVREAQDLIRETIAQDVGASIALEVIRGGKTYEARATLAARPEAAVKPTPSEMPAPPSSGGLGLTLKPIPADAAAKFGLKDKAQSYVAAIEPGSPADKAGLQVGDAILEVAGTQDPTIDDVKTASAKGTLLLRVARKEAHFYVAITK